MFVCLLVFHWFRNNSVGFYGFFSSFSVRLVMGPQGGLTELAVVVSFGSGSSEWFDVIGSVGIIWRLHFGVVQQSWQWVLVVLQSGSIELAFSVSMPRRVAFVIIAVQCGSLMSLPPVPGGKYLTSSSVRRAYSNGRNSLFLFKGIDRVN